MARWASSPNRNIGRLNRLILVIRERSDGYVLYAFYLIPDVAKVNRSSEFVLIQSPSLVIGQQVSQNQSRYGLTGLTGAVVTNAQGSGSRRAQWEGWLMTAGLVYASPFVALSLQLCVWRARSPLATPSNTQFMKEGNRFSMFWFGFVWFFLRARPVSSSSGCSVWMLMRWPSRRYNTPGHLIK